MAVTGINVELKDSTLGRRMPSVGNCAIVYGIGESSAAISQIPHLITSLDSYKEWASSEDADAKKVASDPHLLGMVTKFYEKAGSGAYLWLIIAPGATGDFITANSTQIQNTIRKTTAGNYDNRPRIIGWCAQNNDTAAAWLPAVTPTMVASIQTIQNNMFSEGIRFVNVLASNATMDGSVSGITNAATFNAPSVAVALTTSLYTTTIDESTGQITAYTPLKDVGEALGVLSSISVAESIGSHARAAVSQKAFFNDGSEAVDMSQVNPSWIEGMGKNQYLFHRPFPGGMFYNDGATCNDSTKALSRIEFVRLGNAVCDDAQEFFTGVLNTQASVDASGDLDPSWAAQLENLFYQNYCLPRISANQCSGISVEVAAKDGNFVATRTLMVTIKIQPSPNVDFVNVAVMYVTALS